MPAISPIPGLEGVTDSSANISNGHLQGFLAGYKDGWGVGAALNTAGTLEICKTTSYKPFDQINDICGRSGWDVVGTFIVLIPGMVLCVTALICLLGFCVRIPGWFRKFQEWVRHGRGKRKENGAMATTLMKVTEAVELTEQLTPECSTTVEWQKWSS